MVWQSNNSDGTYTNAYNTFQICICKSAWNHEWCFTVMCVGLPHKIPLKFPKRLEGVYTLQSTAGWWNQFFWPGPSYLDPTVTAVFWCFTAAYFYLNKKLFCRNSALEYKYCKSIAASRKACLGLLYVNINSKSLHCIFIGVHSVSIYFRC